MMDIVHKNDRWEPAVGEYKNCIVLYNDHWNDYCYNIRKSMHHRRKELIFNGKVCGI